MKNDFMARMRAGLGHDRGLDLNALPAASPRHPLSASIPIGPGGPGHGRTQRNDCFDVELAELVPDPEQPRRTFDDAEIEHLAASLLAHGQQTPLVVRFDAVLAKHVVINGEKRLRAARKANLPRLTCMLDSREREADDRKILQLIDDLHRGDISALDRARAFRELMGRRGWTGAKLAEELRIAPATVSRVLTLLDADPETLAALEAGETTASKVTGDVQAARRKSDGTHKKKKRTSTRTYKVEGGTVITRLVGGKVGAERFVAAAEEALGQARDAARSAERGTVNEEGGLAAAA